MCDIQATYYANPACGWQDVASPLIPALAEVNIIDQEKWCDTTYGSWKIINSGTASSKFGLRTGHL